MVFTESAKLMDANEIKQMMDDEYYANPTVERLVFLEPKPKAAEANSKIFPMFIESVGVSADKTTGRGGPILLVSANLLRADDIPCTGPWQRPRFTCVRGLVRCHTPTSSRRPVS